MAHDRTWRTDLRDALLSAACLLGLLLLVDTAAAGVAPTHVALWAALAVLLFVVLLPPRVAVGHGWLSARGLWREPCVRTDHLVSLSWHEGVSRRLILRDAFGARLEIDPRVLIKNPGIWHQLAHDVRTSTERCSLTSGAVVFQQLSRRVDRETTRLLFKISGLE